MHPPKTTRKAVTKIQGSPRYIVEEVQPKEDDTHTELENYFHPKEKTENANPRCENSCVGRRG